MSLDRLLFSGSGFKGLHGTHLPKRPLSPPSPPLQDGNIAYFLQEFIRPVVSECGSITIFATLANCVVSVIVSGVLSPTRRPYGLLEDPGEEVDITDFPWQAATRRNRQAKENFMDMTDNYRSFTDESVRMKHNQYICKLFEWNARSEYTEEHAYEISIL